MFRWFRRHPLKWLEMIPVPGLRQATVFAYRAIDRGGIVSDVIADPQTLLEPWWPYRFFRRRLAGRPEPLVSVVVATRNNAGTLERSIRSLAAQTHRNLEIIVVDDASEDASMRIVEALAREDGRIRYLRNPVHRGTGASRNRGMDAATGDYVTFQDGDDTSLPTRIEAQVAAFRRNAGRKVVTCNYVRVNAAGRRIRVNDKRIMVCVVSMMFPRREILEKVGYFDDISVSEDTDLLERIRIAFGRDCHANVFRTLYLALFQPTSTFFSDVEIIRNSETEVAYRRSATAASAYAEIRARHARMRAGKMPVYIGNAEREP